MSLARTYEKQLLGRIISSVDDYYAYADGIVPDLFVTGQKVIKVYLEAISSGMKPNLLYLKEHCQDQSSYIIGCVEGIDFSIPMEDLIGVLEEDMRCRLIDEACSLAKVKGTSEEKANAISKGMASVYMGGTKSIVSGYEVAKRLVNNIGKESHSGIRTGFPYFDFLTGGLQDTDLIIIAGEPSQGKTSLSLNIAENVLSQGKSLLFVSLEMSEDQIMNRMISAKSEYPTNVWHDHLAEIMNVASSYHDKGFYIADISNSSVHHIVGLIRSAQIRKKVDVVFIDYLQLMSSEKSRSREEEVGSIARVLKNLAKELSIPIVVLSQLHRGKDSDPKPTLRRLRDSGQIEEAADVVWFIYRPETYGRLEYNGEHTNGMTVHIVAKGRNYGTGEFLGGFKEEITKFTPRWSSEQSQQY